MADELSPRQIAFLKNYNDPNSDTFSNATQSAIKAGYSQEYADNITSLFPDWLSEAMGRRKRIVEKAEKNLDNFMDTEDEKIKADMTKFALTRLKKEEYSERSELTGANGGPIETKSEVSEEEFDSLMAGYAKRKENTGSEETL